MLFDQKTVAGYHLLGPTAQHILQVAFENARPTNDGLIVDGLDGILRATGKVAATTINRLEKRGYLVPIGEIPTAKGGRARKRHKLVLDPPITEYQPLNGPGTGQLVLTFRHKDEVRTFVIDHSLRLSIKTEEFSIEIAEE